MPPVRRLLAALCLPLALAACGAESVWAPDEEVQRAAYRHDAPPSVTLITVISNRNNSGAHTALLVNGSQRVIFDPAGTFKHPHLPERNDVVYGITPAALDFYIDYHARETFHVVSQEVPVTPDVAEAALAAVQNYGAVPKAFCSSATANVLRATPGFQDAPNGFSPKALMQVVATKPGVKETVVYDDSPADNKYLLGPDLRPSVR